MPDHCRDAGCVPYSDRAGGGGPFRVDGIVQWDWLAMAALSATFVLIVADILLDRLAGNRLR
jgi:hypothetical protein